MKKTLFAVISVLIVVSMLFVACSDKKNNESAGNGTTAAVTDGVTLETNGDVGTADAVETEKNTDEKATEGPNDSEVSEQTSSERVTSAATENAKETDKETEKATEKVTEKATESDKVTETESDEPYEGDWNLGEADPI